jgi:general nucleoside transport system permease protein
MRLPGLEIAPRTQQSTWARARGSLVGLGVGLALGALLLELLGVSAAEAYAAILKAAFTGGPWALSDTLTKATPLMLCALGCALAFRAGLWNVGAEGQLFLGAWAAAGVASFWLPAGTPGALVLPLMALAGFAAGAAWGALPGLLRARLGVSEILTTLMLTYVAVHWNNLFIYSAWSDRGFQMTPLFPEAAWLPRLSALSDTWPALSGLTLHAGFPLALLAAVAVWALDHRTRLGFELQVAGVSERAARAAGMPVGRNMLLAMALSGGLAGLAGMCEVSGVVHRLQQNFLPGYGYAAILVAWLARLHPAGVVLISVLLAGLLSGAKQVQPGGIAMLLEGVILTSVVAADFFGRHTLRLRRARAPAGGAP